MPATYEKITSTTVSNNTTTYVEFSNISQNFTDLVVMMTLRSYSATGDYVYAQYGYGTLDTGLNYHTTTLGTSTSTITSTGWNDRSNFNIDYFATPETTNPSIRVLNIMNYSNSTTKKIGILRSGKPTATDLTIGMWKSLNPIDIIRITINANYFASGATFSIYGIKAA